MKPVRISLLLTVVFVFAFSVNAQLTPRAAVDAFYRFDGTHSQTFNRANIIARKRWFTDSFYLQLQNELRRRRDYLRQNPDEKPHFGDGLPFRPLDETCRVGRRSYRSTVTIGNGTLRGSIATVPVIFSYPKSCRLPSTKYSVRLRHLNGGWRINDLEFPDGSTWLADLMRTTY